MGRNNVCIHPKTPYMVPGTYCVPTTRWGWHGRLRGMYRQRFMAAGLGLALCLVVGCSAHRTPEATSAVEQVIERGVLPAPSPVDQVSAPRAIPGTPSVKRVAARRAIPNTRSVEQTVEQGTLPGEQSVKQVVEREALPDEQPVNPFAAAAWRRLSLVDESGEIPANALTRAFSQRQANLARQSRDPLVDGAGLDPAEWVFRGPANIGGRTRSIVIHPTQPETLWAGSVSGGVWKSLDAGISWQPLDDFMLNLAVGCLVMDPADPDRLYAGTGEGYFNADAIRGKGVFKTTDGGANWVQLPSTAGWDNVARLAISPTDSNVILASIRYGGLRRSEDGGETWTTVRDAQGSFFVAFHPTDGNKAIAQILDYDDEASSWYHQAVFSTDGGVTWQVSSGGLEKVLGFGSRIELSYAPSNPEIVYANCGGEGGKVWASNDGGQTYVKRTEDEYTTGAGWYYDSIWVSPTDPQTLVVGSYHLHRSTDGGATFEQISNGYILTDQPHPDNHCLVSHPDFDGVNNKQVYNCSDGGVFRTDDIYAASTDGGWVSLSAGYDTSQFYGAAGHGGTGLIVGGTQDNGSLKVETGNQTAVLSFGGDGGFAAIDSDDDHYTYGEYVYLQVHRSTDRGDSASYIHDQLPDARSGSTANFIAPFTLDPNAPEHMLAGGVSLWRSSDLHEGGQPQWTQIRPAGSNKISAIAVAQGDGNLVWVAQNDGKIARCENALGQSPVWQAIDDNDLVNPLPNRYPTRILIDPDDHQRVLIAFGGFSGDNLQRTLDGGTTWEDLTGTGETALPDAPIRGLARHPCRPDWLYAGTQLGIFTSEDGGATWSAGNEGPANVSIDELNFMHHSTTLLAATHGRGLWTVETGGLDDDGDHMGEICDCAPNDGSAFASPDEVSSLRFESETTLSWRSEKDAAGQGTVYDIISGNVADLPVSSGAPGVCEADSLDALTLEVSAVPAVGTAAWYLVRAANTCGDGSWGSDSDAQERSSAACGP